MRYRTLSRSTHLASGMTRGDRLFLRGLAGFNFFGAFPGGARHAALGEVGEGRTLVDHAEAQAEGERGADIEVGDCELIAEEPRTRLHRVFERRHGAVVIAP